MGSIPIPRMVSVFLAKLSFFIRVCILLLERGEV